MTRPLRRYSFLLTCAVTALSAPCRLVAQGLDAPRYRPRAAAARAGRILDSLLRLDEGVLSLRRVLVDSVLGGATWIEFEPGVMARTSGAQAPEAAAAGFLARYGPKVFGTGLGGTDLDLRATNTDGQLTHFRYAQSHGGHRVLGGQLTVHVARVSGAYVVQSANGWLFPDVAAPAAAAYDRVAAERAALAGLLHASVRSPWDTTLLVVPDDETFRLTYLVPVFDSTRELVMRYVDAQSGTVFGETPDALTITAPQLRRSRRTALVDSGAARPPREAPGSLGKSLAGYVPAQGTDWFGQSQTFVVWFTGTVYQMADNSHPGAKEVRIHNMAGFPLEDPCTPTRPIVQRTASLWPAGDASAKEEVSAIHNLGESVTYYKAKFGRNGMYNNSTWNLYGCVHGVAAAWNSYYSRADLTLKFRVETPPDGPSVAAQDVATHEFQHGVSHHEIGDQGFSDSDFETRAVNEGLSDYFGGRHRNVSCHAIGVKFSSSCRELNNDSTLQQRYAACGTSPHCLGIAFSSALWVSTLNLPTGGDDETDQSVYNGLRYYMTATTPMWAAREAVVRAAKDRAHNNQSQFPIVVELETQFFNRGVGPAPITFVGLSNYVCGEWAVGVTGSGTRLFTVRFESGAFLNQDGSVNSPSYGIDLGTYDAGSLPAYFSSAQVGGHTGTDGHSHSVRLGFTATAPAVGWLYYYGGHSGGCGIQPSVDVDAVGPNASLPTRFAVRQAIQTANGVITAQTLGTVRSSDGGQAPSLGAQIRQHGVTAVEVDIPVGSAATVLEIRVYDLQGRLVRRLATDNVTPGTQRVGWDGRTASGTAAPAGVYVVLVRYGSNTKRTHFVLPLRQ